MSSEQWICRCHGRLVCPVTENAEESMKGQKERQAAAAALTAYISKITGQPWSEAHAAEAEAVVEAIASYAQVQPTEHERAVSSERKRKH